MKNLEEVKSGTQLLILLLAALIGGTSSYCNRQFNGNKRNIITSLSNIPGAIVFTYSTLLNGFVFYLLLVVVSMVIIGVGQGTDVALFNRNCTCALGITRLCLHGSTRYNNKPK